MEEMETQRFRTATMQYTTQCTITDYDKVRDEVCSAESYVG